MDNSWKEYISFYVPMWVQEGTYTAQFRSIAVNGEDKRKTRPREIPTEIIMLHRNKDISNILRMYGLPYTIYLMKEDGGKSLA